MKFFQSALVAFGLLSVASASAIPVDKRAVAVEKRTVDLPTAISLVNELFGKVQVYTGSINATSASVGPDSDVLSKTLAAGQIDTTIIQLTGLITEYTGKITSAAKRDIIARQAAPTDLAGVITNLLLEISGALNSVIASLGLSALLGGTLGGLVTALSGLLLALVPVVDNLLALVRQLLDGLLIGLSLALAGLII